MPPTFFCYSGILVSAILVVCLDCWWLAGDADCPFRDGTRSRLESYVGKNKQKEIQISLFLGYSIEFSGNEIDNIL